LHVPVTALMCTCLLSAAVLLARVACTWHFRQLYLGWNLFLACVPVGLAISLAKAHRRGDSVFRLSLIGAGWLLFLPNAPYILTDLVHLDSKLHPRFWTDLLLILLFAWSCAFAGFLALFIVHHTVTRRFGARPGWLFVAIVSLLCGVGVYLGRFERWNSWDILLQPWGIFHDLWDLATDGGRKFVILFSTMVMIGYVSLYSLVQMSAALHRMEDREDG
jgi:uncharacterized membrane protein